MKVSTLCISCQNLSLRDVPTFGSRELEGEGDWAYEGHCCMSQSNASLSTTSADSHPLIILDMGCSCWGCMLIRWCMLNFFAYNTCLWCLRTPSSCLIGRSFCTSFFNDADMHNAAIWTGDHLSARSKPVRECLERLWGLSIINERSWQVRSLYLRAMFDVKLFY